MYEGFNPNGEDRREGGRRPQFDRNAQGYDRNSYRREGGYYRNEGSDQSNARPPYQRDSSTYRRDSSAYRRDNSTYRRPGFKPAGEGAGGPQEQGFRRTGYAPRQGYSPRPGSYQPRREGEAGNREGGYQPRQGGFQRREGGYQPREGGFQRREGGYQSREGGFQRREGSSSNRPGAFNRNTQKRRPGGPKPIYSQKKRIEYAETHIDPSQPIRLNRYLANAGVCSRRDADKYIEAGVVSVNGTVVTELGTKVLRSDEVRFHNDLVTIEKKLYVLLNKPKGYVTTTDDPQERKTVMELVRKAGPERIYPVGRLDRGTTGVLLLTNDGDLATKLTHPRFFKKKIYHVTLDHNVTAADIRQIAEGITLDDGEIRADAIEYASETDKKQIGIEIHSGRNRIVRRIFESLGYHVVKLDRVLFAGLTKKNVKRGDWRYLTEEEVNMLRMGAFE